MLGHGHSSSSEAEMDQGRHNGVGCVGMVTVTLKRQSWISGAMMVSGVEERSP